LWIHLRAGDSESFIDEGQLRVYLHLTSGKLIQRLSWCVGGRARIETSEQHITMDTCYQCLSNTTPIKYVDSIKLRALSTVCTVRHLVKGEELYTADDTADKSAFILCSGAITITDKYMGFIALINQPYTLFDEVFVIFDETRERIAIAKGHTSVVVIPAAVIEELLEDASQMRFAQALGSKLRVSLGISSALSGFEFALRAALLSGSVDIRQIIPAYKSLSPAIHAGANDPTLDVTAWSYAVHRLPQRINEIFALVLGVNKINVMNSPTALRGSILSVARRRTCRMLMPGKAFLLLRPGQSDITDFVTCLCLHTVEVLKLRALMKPIQRTMAHLVTARDAVADGADREAVTASFLSHMKNISDTDKQALASLYKGDLLEQLMNICIHRGDFVIYADTVPVEVSECTAAEKWEQKVENAAMALTGVRVSEWDSSLAVDIISSNRISVMDLLSPFLHDPEVRRRIMTWAEQKGLDLLTSEGGGESSDELDNAYYVAADKYFEAHPEELKVRREYESKHGIAFVDELEYTGISVQILFMDRLLSSVVSCDSVLKQSLDRHHKLFPPDNCEAHSPRQRKKHVIVNIDYAFGEQAEHVLWSLLNLFSLSVRSVNVMGKAGGLQGSRGDVMFPTHFIHERGDIPDFRSVDNQDVDIAELHELAQRCVHVGPMVTIPGTLMQNRRALRLYHTIWASIGLEMEGVYFVQALEKAKVMGIVNPTVQSRFLYYISDLPMAAGASLAKPMTVAELIPPLYAISRTFLLKCLACSQCSSLAAVDTPLDGVATVQEEEGDDLRPRTSTISSTSFDPSDDGSTSTGRANQKLKHFKNVCRAVARFQVSGKNDIEEGGQQSAGPDPSANEDTWRDSI